MLTDKTRLNDFPALAGMTYLNTAAESIPPACVPEALAQYARDKALGMRGREAHNATLETCREVAAKIGEMVTYTEMWLHAMDGVEHGAHMGEGGVMSLGSMTGMNIYFAQTSARMVQILREVSGSGLIMQPSENDLASPELRPYLDRYMRGKGVGAEYKSRLYRLAHDLAVSSSGMRQEVYEYWHGGDPNRNRINLLRGFDQDETRARIEDLVSRPLPHGE